MYRNHQSMNMGLNTGSGLLGSRPTASNASGLLPLPRSNIAASSYDSLSMDDYDNFYDDRRGSGLRNMDVARDRRSYDDFDDYDLGGRGSSNSNRGSSGDGLLGSGNEQNLLGNVAAQLSLVNTLLQKATQSGALGSQGLSSVQNQVNQTMRSMSGLQQVQSQQSVPSRLMGSSHYTPSRMMNDPFDSNQSVSSRLMTDSLGNSPSVSSRMMPDSLGSNQSMSSRIMPGSFGSSQSTSSRMMSGSLGSSQSLLSGSLGTSFGTGMGSSINSNMGRQPAQIGNKRPVSLLDLEPTCPTSSLIHAGTLGGSAVKRSRFDVGNSGAGLLPSPIPLLGKQGRRDASNLSNQGKQDRQSRFSENNNRDRQDRSRGGRDQNRGRIQNRNRSGGNNKNQVNPRRTSESSDKKPTHGKDDANSEVKQEVKKEAYDPSEPTEDENIVKNESKSKDEGKGSDSPKRDVTKDLKVTIANTDKDKDTEKMSDGSFRCHVCNVNCRNQKSFTLHMQGKKHQDRMNQMFMYQKEHEAQSQARMVAEKHLRQIEHSKKKCNICDREYLGDLLSHQRTSDHKRKERLVIRGCPLCKIESPFQSYPEYVKHIAGAEHKKKKKRGLRPRCQVCNKTFRRVKQLIRHCQSELHCKNKTNISRPSADEVRPTEDEDEEQLVTIDAVGECSDEEEKDEEVSKKVTEEDTSKTVEPKVQEVVKVEVIPDLPAYDGSTPLGQDHVVPVTGFFCKLCSKFYNHELAAKVNHCKTKAHYEKLKVAHSKKRLPSQSEPSPSDEDVLDKSINVEQTSVDNDKEASPDSDGATKTLASKVPTYSTSEEDGPLLQIIAVTSLSGKTWPESDPTGNPDDMLQELHVDDSNEVDVDEEIAYLSGDVCESTEAVRDLQLKKPTKTPAAKGKARRGGKAKRGGRKT